MTIVRTYGPSVSIYVLEKLFWINVHNLIFKDLYIQNQNIFDFSAIFAKFRNKYLKFSIFYVFLRKQCLSINILNSKKFMKEWVQQRVKCIWLKQGVTRCKKCYTLFY